MHGRQFEWTGLVLVLFSIMSEHPVVSERAAYFRSLFGSLGMVEVFTADLF